MIGKKPNLGILISGRGSNMKTLLEKIKAKKLPANPVLVFSDKADAPGLQIAKSYGVATVSFSPKDFSGFTEYEKELVKTLKEHKVEWIACAGYMRILRKTMLESFRGRIINIHPSLLPAFPGLKAQKQAIDYGVKYSGCTVHFVNEGVDSGPVIMQRTVEVAPGETEESLSRKIIKEEHDIYWRALNAVLRGYTIKGRTVVFKKSLFSRV